MIIVHQTDIVFSILSFKVFLLYFLAFVSIACLQQGRPFVFYIFLTNFQMKMA